MLEWNDCFDGLTSVFEKPMLLMCAIGMANRNY
jgi:hypothetical protein